MWCVRTCVCRVQKRALGILFYHSLSYSLWHGFVIAPGVRLAASRFQPCALLFLTQCHITDACGHTQFSTWVLGLRIHVLMIVQQALLPSEPSPQPLSFSLEFYARPRLARVCGTASRLGSQVGSTMLRSFSFLSEAS